MACAPGEQGRLAGRLRAARRRAFVGRKAELAAFDEALCDGGVLFVHGPGGIGKSALLSRFAERAEAAGRTVLLLDGRTLDPSPAAFLAATGPLPGDERVVLLVDAFEHVQALEGWLRERFLPALSVGALVVVSGRTPPDLMWHADPGWAGLLRVIALGELEPMDAAALLDSRGVSGERRDPLLAFAHGHPLALALGAATAAGDRWTPGQGLVTTLIDQLVGDMPGPAHRRALEVCAHTYLATQDVLRAVLPDDDPAALFAWLRRLPFVESSPLGLYPHDVVREILDTDLRGRDPHGHADLHQRITTHLAHHIRTGPDPDVLGAVGSLLHLYGETGPPPHVWQEIHEDVLRPEDAEDLLRLAGEPAAHWLDRQPQAFRLYRRTATGELAGASAWLRLDTAADAQADPIAATAWADAHADAPLRSGEHLAVHRAWVRECHGGTSPVRTLIRWRTVARVLRSERLAWSFVVDPVSRHVHAHDWRAVPAQAWLDRLASYAPVTGELAVLSREQFTDAVRGALRHLSKPAELAANPLTRTRLLAGRADPATALRELLEAGIRELGGDPRAGKPHRALHLTYVGGAPTQEAAAERLGLSFTTYRRHLVAGIERLRDDLWRRELDGSN